MLEAIVTNLPAADCQETANCETKFSDQQLTPRPPSAHGGSLPWGPSRPVGRRGGSYGPVVAPHRFRHVLRRCCCSGMGGSPSRASRSSLVISRSLASGRWRRRSWESWRSRWPRCGCGGRAPDCSPASRRGRSQANRCLCWGARLRCRRRRQVRSRRSWSPLCGPADSWWRAGTRSPATTVRIACRSTSTIRPRSACCHPRENSRRSPLAGRWPRSRFGSAACWRARFSGPGNPPNRWAAAWRSTRPCHR
jgi:hypothetical protein